jgi:hypothetical protein
MRHEAGVGPEREGFVAMIEVVGDGLDGDAVLEPVRGAEVSEACILLWSVRSVGIPACASTGQDSHRRISPTPPRNQA